MNSEHNAMEPNDEEKSRLEAHRAFAREIDRELGKVYGFGGLSVLAAVATVLVIASIAGWITAIATWMIALTVGLIALWLLRSRVWKARDELRSRVISYCEVNALDAASLQEYYASENMYPYFVAVFEERPTANPRELDDA